MIIEVKQVGRAVEGEGQLFEYAFHQGVPLCVVTDGREWSFYLPSGQGSYEDRRVYCLQLDEREPHECERVLTRYLSRDRVRSQRAFEDAVRDHRDASGKREAVAKLPEAWTRLVAEAHEMLIDTLSSEAETISGFRPGTDDVLAFLRRLRQAGAPTPLMASPPLSMAPVATSFPTLSPAAASNPPGPATTERSVSFTMLGKSYTCATAKDAVVEILRALAARDPMKLEELAAAVRTERRSLLAHTPAEINPTRPDLARGAEFAPGWLVGLNTSNREKMGLIRSAAKIYGLSMPEDLDIALPNG